MAINACPECGRDTSTFPREALPVRTRPAPDKWSPLEYACHVRDVLRLYDYRLELMQHPGTVANELGAAASVLAGRFAGVTGAQWERTGNRSDGARFTVETFGRYFIHDPCITSTTSPEFGTRPLLTTALPPSLAGPYQAAHDWGHRVRTDTRIPESTLAGSPAVGPDRQGDIPRPENLICYRFPDHEYQ
jgi:hypothetical protein